MRRYTCAYAQYKYDTVTLTHLNECYKLYLKSAYTRLKTHNNYNNSYKDLLKQN